ncbi:beta strand repeat-containing protein [Fimbriiglobus ruber]|uniref:Alkaline phosphatase n=1 Tax=Fimbriiglobus ruber TaxID=1908690 RepID=A0A225DSB4_9BACT|nr:Ig-like domain-containing protein [Fimbriiglobus ruber]OWK40496.1 Alkaline phosphatase [Fimbriiglobus ruber]
MSLFFWKKLVMARMTEAAKRHRRALLTCESLESRTTPAAQQIIASSVGAGGAPIVHVFDAATGLEKFAVRAYEASFTGGVRVAVGDVDGDGVEDLITGAGPTGGAVVNVFSGVDGHLVRSFLAGDATNRGGVSVAAADFDGDGSADIVVGAIQDGRELVQVLRGTDGTVLQQYRPFDAAIEGVTVAAGDYNGDGTPDVIVGAGVGGAPRVTVLDGASGAVLLNTFVFESTARGGIQLAAGDLDGDGKVEVVAAPGAGGGPRVVAISGGSPDGGAVLHNFFGYDDSSIRNGVQVSVLDVNQDGHNDIVIANGQGQSPQLRAFDGQTLARLPDPQYPGLPFGTAAVITTNTVRPTAAVNTASADPTNASPIPFTVTFSEAVTGFTAGSVSVTNGFVTSFTPVSATTYTLGVTPAGQGTVSVSVPAGAATGSAGKPNTASNSVAVVFDSIAPELTVDSLTTNDVAPTLTGTVDDPTASVSVSVNGSTFAASVTGTTWAAVVPANLAEGTYAVQVAATDGAGNVGTANGTLVIDTTAPDATVSSTAPDSTNVSPIPFSVSFSEDVTGFSAAGLTVTNGVVTAFTSVSPRTYTFDVAPTGQGEVTVFVPGGVAVDAAGNGNTASNTLSRTFATGTIGLTANPLTTNNTVPTLTGSVDDPTAAVTVTVDGQTVAAVVTGTTWSATIPTPLPEGIYDVNVAASDAAGNTGAMVLAGGLVIDLTAPTATVSTTAADPTNAALIPFTVAFDKDVSGFGLEGLVVQNGTASDFVAVDARTYTFVVAPDGDGLVTVSVAADAATDAAGNGNAASNAVAVTSDRTAPTPTVSSPAPDSTSTNPIPFTVTFDEAVTGFTAAGVTVANGSVIGFATVDARTYTFDVVPAGPGDVTVSVAAGVAADAAGNDNVASNALTRTFTGTVTTAVISTPATDPTNLSLIPFTVTFADDVTGFDQTGLTVTNGDLSDFTAVDARTYTFNVAPAADGPVAIVVAAGAATDSGGHPTAASTFTITSDRTAPAATVATGAASPTNANPIPFTVTFSEDVTGFDETGLDVTNGTVSNFVAVVARTYTFDVAPAADGDVTVTVVAGAATDAAGNDNLASNTATVTSDTTAPTVAITTTELDPTAAALVPFTVTFSEDVTGFDETGLDVTNGTVSNFVAVDARTYTFDVAPVGDGLVTVSVPAGAATDVAGNQNVAGTFDITSERFAPSATVTSPAGLATNASPIPFVVTFSEDVTGFDETGLDVTNGRSRISSRSTPGRTRSMSPRAPRAT